MMGGKDETIRYSYLQNCRWPLDRMSYRSSRMRGRRRSRNGTSLQQYLFLQLQVFQYLSILNTLMENIILLWHVVCYRAKSEYLWRSVLEKTLLCYHNNDNVTITSNLCRLSYTPWLNMQDEKTSRNKRGKQKATTI